MTFDTKKLDKFAENITLFRNQYLSAIMNGVYVRHDYLVQQKKAGHQIPDYGRLFAMDYLLGELIHRQIFQVWNNDDSDEDPDPRRMQSKYVLKKLVTHVENERGKVF